MQSSRHVLYWQSIIIYINYRPTIIFRVACTHDNALIVLCYLTCLEVELAVEPGGVMDMVQLPQGHFHFSRRGLFIIYHNGVVLLSEIHEKCQMTDETKFIRHIIHSISISIYCHAKKFCSSTLQNGRWSLFWLFALSLWSSRHSRNSNDAVGLFEDPHPSLVTNCVHFTVKTPPQWEGFFYEVS